MSSAECVQGPPTRDCLQHSIVISTVHLHVFVWLYDVVSAVDSWLTWRPAQSVRLATMERYVCEVLNWCSDISTIEQQQMRQLTLMDGFTLVCISTVSLWFFVVNSQHRWGLTGETIDTDEWLHTGLYQHSVSVVLCGKQSAQVRFNRWDNWHWWMASHWFVSAQCLCGSLW